MPLCRLFLPPLASAASPLSRAWLLIDLSLLIYHPLFDPPRRVSYRPILWIHPCLSHLLLQIYRFGFGLILLCYVFFFPHFFLVFSFFFACNKARSSLLNLPIYIWMLHEVFALDPDPWVVNVNNILTFGLRRMNFSLGFFVLRAEE
jgi:hypothetical protein